MKKICLLLILFLTALPAKARAPGESFADLVQNLSPAVVNISTTQTIKGYGHPQMRMQFPPGSPFEGMEKLLGPQGGELQERKSNSLGSGFIIDPSGIIITNNHVVAEAEEITITLQDETQFIAKIIGRDKKIDIALLKINTDKKLPFVKFGDSDEARVGDWIIVIGNPYGLGGSVSAGIISARARDINVGLFDDFIQTDAAINQGNSGGPMFDMKGEVIGINTAIFSPSGGNVGIGFALPANLAEPAIKQIQKYGKVKRAWLGVKIQGVTEEIAESLGMKNDEGALVLHVVDGSPAANAGIEEGDVIIKFNNTKISTMRKLPRIVADTDIGDKVDVQIHRNGKRKNLKVTLQEMKEEARAEIKPPKNPSIEGSKISKAKKILGMALLKVDSKIKENFQLQNEEGLFIAGINPKGAAWQRGIREGHVLLKANQKKLDKISDLEEVIAEAKKEGRSSILVLVAAAGEARFIPLPIN